MALRVTTSSGYKTVLKVVNNYGTQGSTYNPQPTYNPQTTYNPQPTAPASYVQPAAPVRYVQPANTQYLYYQRQQQLAAQNAERQRLAAIAAEQERQRQLQIQRTNIRNTGNQLIATNANNEWGGDWWRKQADRLTHENDIAILNSIVERLRIGQSKVQGLSSKKSGIWDSLKRGIGLKTLENQRMASKEAEIMFGKNKDWKRYIEARKRQFERDLAKKQDWLIKNSNSPEYEKFYNDAMAWAKGEADFLNKDITDFQLSQTQLSERATRPMTGNLGTAGRTLRHGLESFGSGIGKGWKTFTSVVSTPQRIANTAKNLINTQGTRMYDDGSERTGGIRGGGITQTVKTAWNQAHDQRMLGFSKQREEQIRNQQPGTAHKDSLGPNHWVTNTIRNLNELRGKYADDVGNFITDPMMLFGPAMSKGGKSAIDKVLPVLGKNKFARDAIINFTARGNQFNQTKIGKAVSWLGKEHQGRQQGFFNDVQRPFQEAVEPLFDARKMNLTERRKAMSYRSKELDDLSKASQHWKQTKQGYNLDLADKLRNLTDEEAELYQRYRSYIRFADDTSTEAMKKAMSFEDVNIPKYMTKNQLGKIKQLANKSESISKKLYESSQKHKDFYPHRQGYIPHKVMKDEDPIEIAKRGVGQSWYGNQQTKRGLQTREELAESWRGRIMSQAWREDPNGKWLKDNFENVQSRARMLKLKAGLRNERIKRIDKDIQAQLPAFERMVGAKSPIRPIGNSFTDKQPWKVKLPIKNGQVHQKRIGKNLYAQTEGNKRLNLSPNALWKKSVLGLRPAWWVNNNLWNLPASVSAGGFGTLKEMAKMTRKNYRKQAWAQADEITGKLSKDLDSTGLLARAATKNEDFYRVAAYNNLLKKGMKPEQARKQVNDWLFDYTTRNWERPIKAAVPFWKWQRGITELAAKMPFKYPRQAKGYTEAYKQFYQRPLEQIPDEEIEYTDPATGLPVKYNRRKAFEGKMKLGNTWFNTPFNAMNPKQLEGIGLNPFIDAGLDWTNNADKYGNPLSKYSLKDIIANKFPQVSLGRAWQNRNNKNKIGWFSESGYGKEAQGYDPSKPNYRKNLDDKAKWNKAWQSYVGVPSHVTVDPERDKYLSRYTKFNKEYFATDWDAEYDKLMAENPDKAYDLLQARRKELARKYGFDWEKDIVKGEWSKYDTETSRRTKRYEEEAQKFNDSYWDEYASLSGPSQFVGSNGKTYWKAGENRNYFPRKFDEWAANSTFKDNPYYRIPYFNEKDAAGNKTGKRIPVKPREIRDKIAASNAKIAAGKAKFEAGKRKYQKKLDYEEAKRTGNWDNWRSKYGDSRKSSPYQYDGKFFKSKESMERYKAYQSGTYVAKQSPYQHDGKFFKTQESMDKYKEGNFWKKYFETDDYDVRDKMLDENPQYRKYKMPTTDAEWREFRSKRKAEQFAKARSIASISKSMDYFIDATPNRLKHARGKKVVYKV